MRWLKLEKPRLGRPLDNRGCQGRLDSPGGSLSAALWWRLPFLAHHYVLLK